MSKPSLTLEDIESVVAALSAEEISKGASQARFEEEFGNYHEQGCLAVSNGSVAIMLALRSLGIGPGDEVIVPAFSYAATASSVVNVGATPVFCDVDIVDWNISPISIEQAITKKTRAVIAVHNYGFCFDIKSVREIAEKFELVVIEDNAEGLGGSFQRQPLGTFFDVSTWSFYGNKIITCGEGGAVSSSNAKLMKKMQLLRGQGMDPTRQFYFLEPGFNFRLSNLSCALLQSQFQRLEIILEERKLIFSSYREQLADVGTFQEARKDSIIAPWLFSMRLNSSNEMLKVAAALANNGIESRPLFYPLPTMPAFLKYAGGEFPNSSEISSSGLSLPTFNGLKLEQVEKICSIIRTELGK